MKIPISLSVASLNLAINTLRRYDVEKLMDKTCQLVGQMGKEIVEGYFPICEVSFMPTNDGYVIIAEGEQVMFLEFGTGIYTDSDYGENLGLTIVEPGMWSQTEGKGYFRPGHEYWYFGNNRIEGTRGTKGFYYASKEMRQKAAEIARGVFKNYYDRH